MTLESNLNPNDIDPPPRIMGSLVLIHAVSGLCCGVFGLIQMAQPDFFATQFVPGYEGPDVPQAIKLVGILAMAPLPLLLILEAMAGIGLITASRQAVALVVHFSSAPGGVGVDFGRLDQGGQY